MKASVKSSYNALVRPTRRGVKDAAAYLGGIIGAVGFGISLAAGATLFGAFLIGSLCAAPFLFVEELFDPNSLPFWRANWKPYLVTMLAIFGLISAWKAYMAATGMTKAQRIHDTLAVSWVLPVLMLVGFALAYRKGYFRPVRDEASLPMESGNNL